MQEALYGEHGFYRRPEGPAGHFRTSVHASRKLFATALSRLLAEVDAATGHPPQLTVVDVGAGHGELLTAMTALTALADPGLASRLRPVAVEVAERPESLPSHIEWSATLPEGVTGLLVANEWLDNVPLDIVERGEDGVRLVLVDPATGEEHPGAVPDAAATAWLTRWWPQSAPGEPGDPGERAEIGTSRDEAWAKAVGSLAAGLALAVDYTHTRTGRPRFGTLAGYRQGRLVDPVPDGSCDLTCHVALDSCAAAGQAAGAEATVLISQRQALHSLGIRPGRPPYELARSDPAAYLRALQEAGEAGELTAREGLGGFGWLAQTTGGCPMPQPLAALGTPHAEEPVAD
jgi:SAM-dependent MidA family methyltransferase